MDKLRNVDENRPIDYLNLNERFIESREIRLTISLSRILIKISIFEDTENHDAIFSTRREDFEDLENLEIEKKNEKGRGEFLTHLIQTSCRFSLVVEEDSYSKLATNAKRKQSTQQHRILDWDRKLCAAIV